MSDEIFSLELDAELEVRDAAKREVDVRLVPWDVPIDTLQGREVFVRGAFDDVDPKSVLLMGLEHEAHIGLGQGGQPVLTRRPVGKSTALTNRDDGEYATFRVAKTQAGDELLELAAEKIVRGVSVEFTETPGGTTVEKQNGRRTLMRRKVGLPGASLTYRPAYGEQAAVLAVRSQPDKEITPVENTTSPEPISVQVAVDPVQVDSASLAEALEPVLARSADAAKELFESRIASLEEHNRTNIVIPTPESTPLPPYHLWFQRAAFKNEKIPADLAEKFRALEDVVTPENAIPMGYLPEFENVMSLKRPFLDSTRQLSDPGGTSIQTPRITQHTQAGVQSSEKTAVASRALKSELDTWNGITIAAGVDVSIQYLRRAPAAAVQLLDDDLRAQLAQLSESEALSALLDQNVTDGGDIDPESVALGAAFANAYAAMGEAPDTLWVSTDALASFIDAKANGTNAPLYGSIQASASAAGGITGSVSGLRVVHVPQLTEVDAIAGPSRAFAWVQDGPVRLSADNVELAGRDIGYVGYYIFIPRYAAAFTTFALAS